MNGWMDVWRADAPAGSVRMTVHLLVLAVIRKARSNYYRVCINGVAYIYIYIYVCVCVCVYVCVGYIQTYIHGVEFYLSLKFS